MTPVYYSNMVFLPKQLFSTAAVTGSTGCLDARRDAFDRSSLRQATSPWAVLWSPVSAGAEMFEKVWDRKTPYVCS